ncbi:hypothetical protein ACFV4P_13380 [Kitasatospora sp. NPDC059795]|uniref:hypothetical protein n=1 Tax=Kitasatospora sp. NPDC059795 TaxID=3346949 RepID=UPI00364BCC28
MYRALAEAEENAAAEDDLPQRSVPARIRQPENPLTAEAIDLRERLVAQRAVLTAAEIEEVDP